MSPSCSSATPLEEEAAPLDKEVEPPATAACTALLVTASSVEKGLAGTLEMARPPGE